MKRNSKQFLALFMAVAMSVTPVSYAYAEDSAVAGVENTESGQQTVEVTDGKIGAADAAGQPAEEVTGQEEETTAGQGTDEKQKSQEEPKEEENAATGSWRCWICWRPPWRRTDRTEKRSPRGWRAGSVLSFLYSCLLRAQPIAAFCPG